MSAVSDEGHGQAPEAGAAGLRRFVRAQLRSGPVYMLSTADEGQAQGITSRPVDPPAPAG